MNTTLEVQMVPLAVIVPYIHNPRKNDKGVDAVAASIKEFGFRVPIVCDENMLILAGHTRYKAALKLGLKEVPVHIARGLTPAQMRAYRIADNKTASFSEWDYELLIKEITDLKATDYDLKMTGFDDKEISKLLATKTAATQDESPAPPAEPISQLGDVWLCGAFMKCPHCGHKNPP